MFSLPDPERSNGTAPIVPPKTPIRPAASQRDLVALSLLLRPGPGEDVPR
jgi:hypothetical protein